jgi:bifunctional hydroxylase/dehydrase
MTETVVIVGAGPTGLMLAHELAVQRVPVVVVERRPKQTEALPGMAINATVVDLLHQRGLMEPVAEHGFEFPQAHFAQLWLDPVRVAGRHQYNFVVSQANLERTLAAEAVAKGVEIRRGLELVGLVQDETGAVLTLRSADGGEQSLACRFVVGCDGPDSTVRELAGIGFPGRDFPFLGIVGDLEVGEDSALMAYLGAKEFPRGLLTVGPLEPGVLRVATAEFDERPADRTAEVGLEELRESALRLDGVDLGEVRVRWLRRWDAASRQAERYRDGAVLLAGDAAHMNVPLGGQSMSTGIEDAVNLGWKLAATLHGWAPEGLLDTYHAERHPVGARACSTTEAQLTLLHPLDRMEPLRSLLTEMVALPEVNEFLVKLVYALDVRYPLAYPGIGGEPHPLVGQRLPDVPLTAAEGDTSVARLINDGRGVVVDLRGVDGGDVKPSGWSDRVDVVTVEPTEEIAASLLLLRPDGRVAWAEPVGGAETGGLAAALEAWFGAA